MKFFVLVSCVTVKIMCSRINDNFYILNNVLGCLKRCGDCIRWCLRSFLTKIGISVDKSSLSST